MTFCKQTYIMLYGHICIGIHVRIHKGIPAATNENAHMYTYENTFRCTYKDDQMTRVSVRIHVDSCMRTFMTTNRNTFGISHSNAHEDTYSMHTRRTRSRRNTKSRMSRRSRRNIS